MPPVTFRLARNVNSPLKVVSTFLIASALGLELWNLGAKVIYSSPLQGLEIFFFVERLALLIHGIEAAIAASYASSRQQSPLRYGLYTFFVGTVGLMELFQLPTRVE